MRMLTKVLVLGVTAGLAALALAACGGGGGGGGGGEGGTATVLMGTAPDYLDPQESYTTQGAEADWISYTPLVTYKHENAPSGNDVIPGLATDLPHDLGGRQDLHPDPAQGPRLLERAAGQGERLQVHGRAHDQGQLGRQELRHRQRRRGDRLRQGPVGQHHRASRPTMQRGKITIQLDKPYGAFTNVLAFPDAGAGPVRHAGAHADDRHAAGRRRRT